jgi:tetratricopeptide (TPR) repeat protein
MKVRNLTICSRFLRIDLTLASEGVIFVTSSRRRQNSTVPWETQGALMGISINQATSGNQPGNGGDGTYQLIRAAEKYIMSGKYAFALEHLATAQKLDPNNKYILAIIERVEQLKASAQSSTSSLNIGGIPIANNPKQLAITVGNQFESGFKDVPDQGNSNSELQLRLRHLTSLAEQFLDQGSCQNAFDSLMKAYLLDPMSPYVIACEKSVLPRWEKERQKTYSTQNPGLELTAILSHTAANHEGDAMPPQKNDVPNSRVPVNPPLPGASTQQNNQEQRLELLKKQKEFERQEKERALWREASKPPKVLNQNEAEQSTPATPPTPRKEESGLFSKLRLGKFLG